MSQELDVVALVGSLRGASYNRALVTACKALAPAALKIEIVAIAELPFYDQDAEASPPASWVGFRARIKRADAVLFATPEYNRGVPGVLKNAVDVGSRPRLANAFDGKPAAVMSVSPGALGGFAANAQLRQSLFAVNMATMAQPEAYLGNAAQLFGADGQVANPATREFITKFLAAFETWIRRFRS